MITVFSYLISDHGNSSNNKRDRQPKESELAIIAPAKWQTKPTTKASRAITTTSSSDLCLDRVLALLLELKCHDVRLRLTPKLASFIHNQKKIRKQDFN
ncbi:hypothetical protein [Pseudoalteromonas aurantia]|uniref:hypothetical protein n=1 Tax=Pseudoalteromonas aurantia TaxID=43654 RepID=UPI00148740AB|nr:hypothetical protein [Pseudoalteromonas aurantia]